MGGGERDSSQSLSFSFLSLAPPRLPWYTESLEQVNTRRYLLGIFLRHWGAGKDTTQVVKYQYSTLTLARLPGASKMIQWASKTMVKVAR